MNKANKLLKYFGTALVAVLLAGSVTMTMLQAAGLPVAWSDAYLPAVIAAAACTLAAVSTLTAVLTFVGALAAGAFVVITRQPSYTAVAGLAEAIVSPAAEGLAALAGHETTIAAILAATLASLNYALVFSRRRGETCAALAGALIAIILSNAVSRDANLALALPALVAGIAAYAQTGEQQREGGALQAYVPALLAVGLAFLLLPAGRLTWSPLENAANRARHIFEDYFSFTQERVAFSINEAGYDHAGEIDGRVEPMLGGPAWPDDEPVLRVQTSVPVLLRGSIRGTYTGYSWIDSIEKSRYLYYAVTARGERNEVFDRNRLRGLPGADAFQPQALSVELLREGTSTLFVPNRLTDFSMTLETASYFNTVGELFIARGVQPGDRYRARWDSLTGRSALQAILDAAAKREDDRYEEALALYTALPEGIDPQVYQIAASLTNGAGSPYEAVQAILHYLQSGFTYTLDVDYPPRDRDFVSWFLIDAKEGYCSYFASAMAVLCRMAGLPARYVEGYSAVPDANGEAVLTGRDAHAWVEVYFHGFGWVEFDPTAAARAASGSDPDERRGSLDERGTDDGTPGQPPASAATPTPEPQASPEPTPESGPTPSPAPQASEGGQPTPTPPPVEPDPPRQPPEPDAGNDPSDAEDRSHPWVWVLLGGLILLLLLFLALQLVRRRLRRTDPVRLAAAEKNETRAAMILYRSCLTLLRQLGQTPLSGETPEAFAARISGSATDGPDFADFSRAVALNRYAGHPIDQAALVSGARAWRGLERKLGRLERLRFNLRRLTFGLGDFEQIP